MKVISGEKFPIKVWASLIEEEAERQLRNMANLPFIYKWIAAMPDIHAGMGATIGSVIATKNAILPSAAGVDLGCGMMAVRFQYKIDKLGDEKRLEILRHSLERSIPTGMNGNKIVSETAKEEFAALGDCSLGSEHERVQNALSQLGSLGSGNHFLEICKDTEDNIWAMLHSGSRNIGNYLAQGYIKQAKRLMEKYHIKLNDPDLAYFPRDTEEFTAYFKDLQWLQNYAKANRREMMRRVIKDVSYHILGCNKIEKYLIDFSLDCHHNYATIENHYGENIIVTRKGAISAREGELGIIPGSMGAKSYIVKGKGNPESFMSCSHGAGRVMSRSKAKQTFTEEDIKEQTKGVVCRKDTGILDELPWAYKDIDQVMEDQKDLVEPVYQLKQLICIKG
jgi:tRNA-splicing ligase RtcB (3'-phosphate/5'-hydroxy nucleic acid ligase)